METPQNNKNSKRRPNPFKPEYIIFLLAVASAYVAFVTLFHSMRGYNRAKSTRTWTSTTGKVVRSRVKTDRDPSMNSEETMYVPEIRYKYMVDGKEYTGKRIGYRAYSSTDSKEVKQALDEYAKKDKIEVYYNPAHPEKAVLERGGEDFHVANLVMSGIFAFVSLALIVYGLTIRAKRKSKEKS